MYMCIVIMSAVIHVHAPHSRADAAVEQIHKTTGDRAYNELFWRQDLQSDSIFEFIAWQRFIGGAHALQSAPRFHLSLEIEGCG